MSDFWIYFEVGLKHVLNIHAYDHILFIMSMVAPFGFVDWKRWLSLVSLFTLGHTLSLFLSVLGVLIIKESFVEFLIPITILIAALYNVFTAGKQGAKSISIIAFVALFFGVIHGLGFANYFKTLLSGSFSDKLLPLGSFALGIECAQIAIVIIMLLLSFLFQSVFRFSKRDWVLVMGAFVCGVVVPLIIDNPFLNGK